LPDGSHSVAALHRQSSLIGGLDSLVPARWVKARSQIPKRREDEEPLPGERMRHDQPRLLDRQAVPPEDEQVEIELPGRPALSRLPSETPLDVLQRAQEICSGRFR